MKKIELLSPVGDQETLYYAIHAGCDAVYLSGTNYGARKYAPNFTIEELEQAVKYCHLYGVKIYVTVNTLIYESEVDQLINYVRKLKEINVDALIMQDLGMIKLVNEIFPNMKNDLYQSKNSLDLLLNVTNDINKKTETDNKKYEKIFSRKKISMTYIIMAICVVMYLITVLMGLNNMNLLILGANNIELLKHGQIYRLITYGFLHGSIVHLISNMYCLYVIGSQVENNLDKKRFLTIYFIPNLLKYGLNIAICGVVLINIISEFSSIIVLMIFLPKEHINIHDFKFDKSNMKDILEISIPTTTTKLIGSLTYFLEPIILTNVLLKVGYNNSYITLEYGIINGYVYPLLLLPSFFTSAISHALLPNISYAYSNGMIKVVKKKLKQSILISLLVGIPSTIIFMIFPSGKRSEMTSPWHR